MDNLEVKKDNFIIDTLVTRMYGGQRDSSKKRGMELPTYTKDELKEWLLLQPNFIRLYERWLLKDCKSKYVPSVDRKNDYVGYTLSNIRLTTWGRNERKGNRDRKLGKNNKTNKSVLQLSKKGKRLNTYHSLMEAERQTGINHSNISAVCNNKKYTAGGYVWRYKDV